MSDPFSRRPLHLELGCGRVKRNAQAIGIDILDDPAVDVVGDALEVLRALPDGCATTVYSEHFMEHLERPLAVFSECARVLKPGGLFRSIIPHFSSPVYYSDPTHRAQFGLYTFSYWANSNFRRKVPHYANLPMTIVHTRLNFKSYPPFYVRHLSKKIIASWVNLSIYTQEFYEENLCWIMPCYELDVTLARSS